MLLVTIDRVSLFQFLEELVVSDESLSELLLGDFACLPTRIALVVLFSSSVLLEGVVWGKVALGLGTHYSEVSEGV